VSGQLYFNPKNAVATSYGLKLHGCNARFAHGFLPLARRQLHSGNLPKDEAPLAFSSLQE
jgi:hypothetical protein